MGVGRWGQLARRFLYTVEVSRVTGSQGEKHAVYLFSGYLTKRSSVPWPHKMGCPSVLGGDFCSTVVARGPLSLLVPRVSGEALQHRAQSLAVLTPVSGQLWGPRQPFPLSLRVLSEAGVTAPASPGLALGSAGPTCAQRGEGAAGVGRHDPCRPLFRSAAGGGGAAPSPDGPGGQLLGVLQLLAQPDGGAGPGRELGQRRGERQT